MAINPQTLRRILLILVWGFLASAVALMIWGHKIAAMLAVFISLGLGNWAKSQPSAVEGAVSVAAAAAPKPVRWSIGAAFLILIAAAYWLLDYAEHHESLGIWPVYLFAAAIGAGAWWAVGLLARWL